jgi:lantibiotic leader peptide-processing serine protease
MVGSLAVGTNAGSDARPTRYIVLYEANASPAAVTAAVKQAKGRILKANNKVGVATAISANPGFRSEAAASAAIKGVARNIPIGRARPQLRPKLTPELNRAFRQTTKGSKLRLQGRGFNGQPSAEPLAGLQWDMRMIHATVDGSYRKQPGSSRVLVASSTRASTATIRTSRPTSTAD